MSILDKIPIPLSRGPVLTEPRSMLLIGHQKIGKTEALLKLPNSLHLDLQESAGFYGGTYVNVKEEARNLGINSYTYLVGLISKLELENTKYDFIIVDTLKELERVCLAKAYEFYRNSSDYSEDKKIFNILNDLGYGKGYSMLNDATMQIYYKLQSMVNKCVIYVAHPKSVEADKDSAELTYEDIDVLGGNAFRNWIAQEVDAIGKFERLGVNDKGYSINAINFKINHLGSEAAGARIARLRGQRFPVSALNEKTGKFITSWDKIFNLS